jgi:excisionase family DNA binding protein
MRALNLNEAAVFLKLHPATLRQRAAVGRIPAARIGRRWVFLEEDLAAYVRKQYPDQWQALQGEHEEVHAMSLYKRKGSPFWWVRFTHNRRRVQESSGTVERALAEQHEARLKRQLWEQHRLGVKPRLNWKEAVVQYLQETRHKATHATDIAKLGYLDRYLGGMALDEIRRDVIDKIARTKAKEASEPTANRYLALIRAVHRRAAYEWEWIDRPPRVRLFS